MKLLCLLTRCLLTAYSFRVKHQHTATQTPDMDCSDDGSSDPEPEPEPQGPTDREVYGKVSDSKKLGSPANGRTGIGCLSSTTAARHTTAASWNTTKPTLTSVQTWIQTSTWSGSLLTLLQLSMKYTVNRPLFLSRI